MGSVAITAGLLAGGTLLLLLLYALRRPLLRLLRLAARTGVGLAVLGLLRAVGGAVGLGLGVNLWNALVIGLLGVPGLGLLMLLHWLVRA